MTKLTWDRVGDRYYETGVNRAVLYTSNGTGVAWSGLTAVTESPSGAETTPQYADNVKYLNLVSTEELDGTIEAFTYPSEFSVHDGSVNLGGISGISMRQQPRKPFGFSYRTLVGNDLSGLERAYKIHMLYNVLAAPSEVNYTSISDSPEAVPFSWEFTTTPVTSAAIKSVSSVVIDSRAVSETFMSVLENYIYGTPSLPARLPTLDQILSWIDDSSFGLRVEDDSETGLSTLSDVQMTASDLVAGARDGMYVISTDSRLVETNQPGLYALEE